MNVRKPYSVMSRMRWLSLLPLLAFSVGHSADEERVEFDPQTGNYIVYYYSYTAPGVLQRVIVVPTTKIDPKVVSKFKLTERGNVLYRYQVKSGKNSRQPLIGFRYEVDNVDPNSQQIPKGWEGVVLFDPAEKKHRVNWSYADVRNDGTAGLLPGNSQQGFSIESTDLPGVQLTKLNGDVPLQMGFPDEGPDPSSPIGKQLYSINEYVRFPSAVPKIVVLIPFDAAAVLVGIQKHIKNDLIGMKLIDPVLASQLDRSLQAAIDAAKINNTTAVRSNLKDLRKLLKKEHEDVDSEDDQDFDKDDATETKKSALIDWLAARVLDFDLKYVEKRLKVE